MAELKPCPFCGGEASTYSMETWWVSHACDCLGKYVGTKEYATEAEAIAAWNTRVDYHGYEQAAIEAWESIKAWNSRAERTCAMIPSFTKPATLDDCQEFCCSVCGEYMVLQQFQGCADDVPNYCPNCGARRVGE